jgi:uncharacterized RDD family membrane protein YckC
MQTVSISTTQNVGIQFELAGLGDRIIASIIDGLILGTYSFGAILLMVSLNTNSYWMIITLMLVPFFYHLICEIFMNGQSIGKKQMNIRVVRLDGNPPTLGAYVLRWITRLIEINILMGAPAIIAIAMTENGQRIGDIAAGTTVVKLSRKTQTSSHTIVQQLEKEHEVQFPQVIQLNDEDIYLIQQVLAAYRTNATVDPVMKVTNKVKEHLNIDSDLPPVKLLHTILKDYNYLTSR